MQEYEMKGEVAGIFYRAEEVETEIAKLKYRIEKQREINRDYVDENEKLKQEIESWKKRAAEVYLDS